MAESIASRSSGQLKLLGLFSCVYETYFIDELKKAQKGLGFIVSKDLLYQADSFKNLVSSVEALLDEKCEDDFNKALNEQDPLKGSRIVNFF